MSTMSSPKFENKPKRTSVMPSIRDQLKHIRHKRKFVFPKKVNTENGKSIQVFRKNSSNFTSTFLGNLKRGQITTPLHNSVHYTHYIHGLPAVIAEMKRMWVYRDLEDLFQNCAEAFPFYKDYIYYDEACDHVVVKGKNTPIARKIVFFNYDWDVRLKYEQCWNRKGGKFWLKST